jgi:hypothetical protein
VRADAGSRTDGVLQRCTTANNRWQQRRLRRLAAGRRANVTSAAWAGGHVAPGPQASPAARRATSASSNVSRHAPHHQNGVARHRAFSSARLAAHSTRQWSWGDNAAINGIVRARRGNGESGSGPAGGRRAHDRRREITVTRERGVQAYGTVISRLRSGIEDAVRMARPGRLIVRCAVVRALEGLVAASAAPDGPHTRMYGRLPQAVASRRRARASRACR